MRRFKVVQKKTGKVACWTDSREAAEAEARYLNRVYQTDNFVVEEIK